MNKKIFNTGIIIFFLIMLVAAGTGCKSKQKIAKAEAKLAWEKEEELKKKEEELGKEAEAKEVAEAKKVAAKYENINAHFKAVAGAENFAIANDRIEKALTLFASENALVLIIISQADGFNDYDRPTTIKKYLEYLMDQKKYDKRIENVVYDANGKITEIELIKK
ncbi:MAG: hypothetical protein KAW86_06295 [Bacteroidales bacterium]|nr:hypothetical protein [Bacteroidales bacterium]